MADLPKHIRDCKQCGGYRREVKQERQTFKLETGELRVVHVFACWACGDEVRHAVYKLPAHKPLLHLWQSDGCEGVTSPNTGPVGMPGDPDDTEPLDLIDIPF